MHLSPEHVTIDKLLRGRLFRIPDYQRAYAWGKKQREDLFSDIREVQRSGQDHFMATIVCLQREKRRIGADQYQAADVVDGQQRLTTVIVLFKAIEKALRSDDPSEEKVKREIGELLVKGDDFALLLLQTNHDSTSVFADYMRLGLIHDGAPSTAAEQNLIDAARECEAFVEKWRETLSLVDLVAIVRHSFSLIYHQLTDEASVYRVFEVLNSRGLDVKWIDKVKSQLMAMIFTHAQVGSREEALQEMKNTWTAVYRVLGLHSELGDEALRFAGTWKLPQQPNRILSQEDAASQLTSAAGNQLRTIGAVADWLKLVVDVVHKLHGNVRIRAVTRIVHARFVATAILVRRFPAETEQRLMDLWEKVTFRIFGLGGADTRFKVGEYVRLGYDIVAKTLDEDDIEESLKSLGEGFSIKEVLAEVDWSDCYHGWQEELRYLLYRYDEYLSRKDGGKGLNQNQWNKIWMYDPSKSIEHIQPQSSEASYVNHIGNLTMLPPNVNSGLKDKSPRVKASTYRTTGLRATAIVGELIEREKKWNKAIAERRAADIERFVGVEWAD